MTTAAAPTIDDTPKAKYFREKIGDKEYELEEVKLDAFDDITLWPSNPRLIPHLAASGNIQSEDELENHLRTSNGYQPLARSIEDIGQMEPVYVWKRDDQKKFFVLEGSTRVTIIRGIAREKAGSPNEVQYRAVKAKVLPPEFDEEDRVILLARIHVRGTGVRSWGRYIEAKFVHDAVVGRDGRKAIMSPGELARHMGKSLSWVSRLKDAYMFAQKFIEHVDSDDAQKLAMNQFSTLEEIAKSPGVGPKVKDYENAEFDGLRGEVFDMVRNEVFREYRDARFMKQYYEDSEKWAVLKQGEKGSANQLAIELKAGNSSLRARIEALPGQLERALERSSEAVDESDIETLKAAVQVAESFKNPGVEKFRLRLNEFTGVLEGASLADIKTVQSDDIARLDIALDDFRTRLAKHKSWT
jgi:hypothetical protein